MSHLCIVYIAVVSDLRVRITNVEYSLISTGEKLDVHPDMIIQNVAGLSWPIDRPMGWPILDRGLNHPGPHEINSCGKLGLTFYLLDPS